MEYLSHPLGGVLCSQLSCLQEPVTELPEIDIMDPLICPRTATVQELARIVLEEGVVHVRGTPTSGKTTLALLLHKYNTDNDVKSVYIRQWSPMKSIEHFGTYHLVWHARAAGFTSVSYDNFESQDITFILDNAQTSYKDDQLWLGPLKDQNNNCRQFGPRFCLFMSYGSPTEGPDDPSPNSIRSGIKILQRVSITVSRLENSPQISLFFTREEFDDVLQRKRCDQKRPVPLDSNAADYLFHLTNGHPGAVEAVLAMIHKAHQSDLLHRVIPEVTKDHILEILDDEKRSFRFLLETPFERSLPKRSNVNANAANILRQVLKNGSIERDLENPGIKECYQRGWLHSEIVDEETEEIVCVFPTRLHAKYVEQYMTRSLTRFPKRKFPTVEALAEAVLREFSPRNLSLETRLGTGAVVRPVEACYQDEFYRCLHQVLGFASHVYSEWSGDGDGRIDFRITDVAWGIEILRDGDRLDAHCSRFVKNGSYTGWIRKGWLKDWLIIDCRSSTPRAYKDPNTKLWRAIFADDYTSIEVRNASNNVIIPRFPLMN